MVFTKKYSYSSCSVQNCCDCVFVEYDLPGFLKFCPLSGIKKRLRHTLYSESHPAIPKLSHFPEPDPAFPPGML